MSSTVTFEDSSMFIPSKMHIDGYPFMALPPGLSLEGNEDMILDKTQEAKEGGQESGSESQVSTGVESKAEDKEGETESGSESPASVSPDKVEEKGQETESNSELQESAPANDAVEAIPSRSLGSENHERGECRPCAYFWTQKDGCRQGADCVFCHLCDRNAMKRYKKAKKDRLKAEAAEAQEAAEAAGEDDPKIVFPSRRIRKDKSEGFKEGEIARIDVKSMLAPEQPPPTFMPKEPATLPLPDDSDLLPPAPPPPPRPAKSVKPLAGWDEPPKPLAGLQFAMPEKHAEFMAPVQQAPLEFAMPEPYPKLRAPAQQTPLSAQSRPYIPAGVINRCSQAVMSTIANETGNQICPKTSKQITQAVASEVEKLVEASFNMVAAERMMARFGGTAACQGHTESFEPFNMMQEGPPLNECENDVSLMRLAKMAEALDSANPPTFAQPTTRVSYW